MREAVGGHPASILPRLVEEPLRAVLDRAPVVLLAGAGGVGKGTLARAEPDRARLSLDDYDTLARAREAPDELARSALRLTVERVERAPELVAAIGRVLADGEGYPGRFLLTAAAEPERLPGWEEAIGDRGACLRVWPLTRSEQRGMGVAGLWGDLLAVPAAEWLELVLEEEVEPESWEELARRGGLPGAVELEEGTRWEWLRERVRRYLEHDLPALSGVDNPVGVHQLMRAASRRIGEVVNQAELARDTGISGPTVYRYLKLLESTHQLVRVEPFLAPGTKRLVRTPRLYWADTAVGAFLADHAAPRAEQLENLVLCDLVAWRDAQLSDARVLHWLAHTGEGVDFLIDWGGRLLPVTVTVADRPTPADARQLALFRAQYPRAVHGALALHAGDGVYWLDEGVLAAPWWRIL